MKRLYLIVLLILAIQALSAQGLAQPSGQNLWPAVTKENKPWTRWWWMGSAVNELELRRLLQEYAAKGFGGVEITPIYGVKGEESNYINFLSEDWMEMLSVSIDEATRVNMGVDMNTGTGWPFGGPSIASENAAKMLRFYTLERVSYDSVHSFIHCFDPLAEETLLALSGISECGERVNFLRGGKPWRTWLQKDGRCTPQHSRIQVRWSSGQPRVAKD